MGWQLPPIGNGIPAFCLSWDVSHLNCCFTFVAKERSEILFELKLGLIAS